MVARGRVGRDNCGLGDVRLDGGCDYRMVESARTLSRRGGNERLVTPARLSLSDADGEGGTAPAGTLRAATAWNRRRTGAPEDSRGARTRASRSANQRDPGGLS